MPDAQRRLASRPSANAAICRTSNSLVAQETGQRLDRGRQPDASDGQCGSTSHPRFRIAEQTNKIGWTRWSEDGRLGRSGRPQDRGSQRLGIAQTAADPRAEASIRASLPTKRRE